MSATIQVRVWCLHVHRHHIASRCCCCVWVCLRSHTCWCVCNATVGHVCQLFPWLCGCEHRRVRWITRRLSPVPCSCAVQHACVTDRAHRLLRGYRVTCLLVLCRQVHRVQEYFLSDVLRLTGCVPHAFVCVCVCVCVRVRVCVCFLFSCIPYLVSPPAFSCSHGVCLLCCVCRCMRCADRGDLVLPLLSLFSGDYERPM